MEHSRCCSDVLACPSEVRKGFIIGDDPSVHITGHGTCVPAISAASDLLVDLLILPNKLLSGFVYFPLLGSQLLHPYMRCGCCPRFGSATEVVCQSSLLRGDAFDVSLEGFRYETFPGGMMAPLARVRARV